MQTAAARRSGGSCRNVFLKYLLDDAAHMADFMRPARGSWVFYREDYAAVV
jgi:hypothetical protein